MATYLRHNPRIPSPVPMIGSIGLFNEHRTCDACNAFIVMSDLRYDEDRFYGRVVEETERLIWIVDCHQSSVTAKHCYPKDYFTIGIINWVPLIAEDIPATKPDFDEMQLNKDNITAFSHNETEGKGLSFGMVKTKEI